MGLNNSIFSIRPYRRGSVWVFDEPELDIFAEPFVSGVNQIIDSMLSRAELPASEPFTAIFSDDWLPDYHLHLVWEKEENGGNWYADVTGLTSEQDSWNKGWLCSVLCKFFPQAPKNIYVLASK